MDLSTRIPEKSIKQASAHLLSEEARDLIKKWHIHKERGLNIDRDMNFVDIKRFISQIISSEVPEGLLQKFLQTPYEVRPADLVDITDPLFFEFSIIVEVYRAKHFKHTIIEKKCPYWGEIMEDGFDTSLYEAGFDPNISVYKYENFALYTLSEKWFHEFFFFLDFENADFVTECNLDSKPYLTNRYGWQFSISYNDPPSKNQTMQFMEILAQKVNLSFCTDSDTEQEAWIVVSVIKAGIKRPPRYIERLIRKSDDLLPRERERRSSPPRLSEEAQSLLRNYKVHVNGHILDDWSTDSFDTFQHYIEQLIPTEVPEILRLRFLERPSEVSSAALVDKTDPLFHAFSIAVAVYRAKHFIHIIENRSPAHRAFWGMGSDSAISIFCPDSYDQNIGARTYANLIGYTLSTEVFNDFFFLLDFDNVAWVTKFSLPDSDYLFLSHRFGWGIYLSSSQGLKAYISICAQKVRLSSDQDAWIVFNLIKDVYKRPPRYIERL